MIYKDHVQYRLPGYNYAGDGNYFVTICTKERRQTYFGRVVNKKMELSKIGEIANNIWALIPTKYDTVSLDEYVVMPNHVHGIIKIKHNINSGSKGNNYCGDPWNQQPQTKSEFKSGIINNPMELEEISLGRIMRDYKGLVKYEAGKNGFQYFAWQPRFYDRVIRNDIEFYFIQEYIINNPANWDKDIIDEEEYFNQNLPDQSVGI